MTSASRRGIAALLALAAAPAAAQSTSAPSIAVSLGAGVSRFDLSGTGDAPVAAFRVERPMLPALVAEVGVAVARPDRQFGTRTTLVIPEVGLQAQYPARVAPYVGVGVGAAIDRRGAANGGTESDFTASGSVGVRAWATERLGLRGELRVRGIGRPRAIGVAFPGSAAEWTVGAAVRF